MVEGLDLYGLYNNVRDWGKVRAADIQFAWFKLSDGNTNRPDYGYVAPARRAGLAAGGYHYAQPGNPRAQAERLVSQCTFYGATDLAPALDIEDNAAIHTWGRQEAIDFSVAFLNRLAELGYRPALYANNSMLNSILAPVRAQVSNLLVWGARYGGNLTVPYHVHQYTSTGTVPGIDGNVDRNRATEIPWNVRPIAAPTTEDEDYMIVPPTHAPGETPGDDYVVIPCNGKTLLFVATAYGRTVKVIAATAVKDNQPNGDPAYTSVAPLEDVNPDEPGPIAIGGGARHIVLRYSANHSFTAWCA